MSKLNSPEIKAQVTPLQRNIFGVFAVSLAGGSAYCAELAHSAYLRLESLAEPATTFGPSPELSCSWTACKNIRQSLWSQL